MRIFMTTVIERDDIQTREELQKIMEILEEVNNHVVNYMRMDIPTQMRLTNMPMRTEE